MTMKKKNKMLIIGATSGLGAALAAYYAPRTEVLALTGRRVEELERLCGARSGMLWARTDVTRPEEAIPALEGLVERMGGADCIVLCAGVGCVNRELDFGRERPAILTNVYGWTAVADWAFGYLSGRGGGHLVAISSIAGVRGLAPAPAYAASKAYQIHYLEALRQRALVGGVPVYVTDIRPGFVRTPLLGDEPHYPGVVTVERVLPLLVRAIERKAAVAVVPGWWCPVVWMMKVLPSRFLAAVLWRKERPVRRQES